MDEFARYTTKLSSSITILYLSLVGVTSKLPSQVPLVVTPRLSPEGIKSEASWIQLGYSHARAVLLAPGLSGHGKNARRSAFRGIGPCGSLQLRLVCALFPTQLFKKTLKDSNWSD